MPYLIPSDQALPFQADPEARRAGDVNTSREGAVAISADARGLRARYVRLLYARGPVGATDQEAADALGIQRTTLIPRRAELGADVAWTRATRHHVVRGRRVGNKVWALAVFIDGAGDDAGRTAS